MTLNDKLLKKYNSLLDEKKDEVLNAQLSLMCLEEIQEEYFDDPQRHYQDIAYVKNMIEELKNEVLEINYIITLLEINQQENKEIE